MKRFIPTVLGGSLLLFAHSAVGQEDYQEATQAVFSYAVKFVCSNGRPSTGRGQGLVTGVYDTAINVHNPSLNEPVVYLKKFVRGFPKQEQGKPTDFTREEIQPNHAFEVECQEIVDRLQATNPPATGFVVFLTRRPLDITAVYTAGATELVSSIDVETIEARELQPQN